MVGHGKKNLLTFSTMAFNAWRSLFCFGAVVCVVLAADVFEGLGHSTNDVCKPIPPGRVPWILHVRRADHGWGADTHRANIALAVNRWRGTEDEMTKMALQLEDELLTALMRDGDSSIEDTDLALFIHALIATKKNPRNFHGTDLVFELLKRVERQGGDVHPFLVLALCNGHAVEFSHLNKIKDYMKRSDDNSTHETWEIEMKAMALKAFACAADLPNARSKGLDKFGNLMREAAQCLVAHQINGVWGKNPYRTSLAVQALTAYDKENWDEQKSLDYLESESIIDVQMIKAYFIEMALNCRSVKFIKDLYGGPIDPVAPVKSNGTYFTTYTIKDEEDPGLYFSVIMSIPQGWTFFKVMERAMERSRDSFSFSHIINKNNEPVIYKAVGKANDAERNMFWRICRQTNIRHDPHTSNITEYPNPTFFPSANEHIFLWYRRNPCPLA